MGRLAWIAGIKVLALLGILVNHLAEAFWLPNGAGSQNWLSLSDPLGVPLVERAQMLWSDQSGFPGILAAVLAWMGNEGPGVFILLSGLGLTLGLSVGLGAKKCAWWPFIQQRARRLYPLYIASVLLFVPVWLIASPGIEWNMAGWTGLAMLTGVRASAEMFGLLNPSWWFFWTLLQLMLVFPALLWVANRIGYGRLFLLALLVTVTTRAYILQWAGQQNLWPLLTGVFAATRLAEFVFGMWIARQLNSHRFTVEHIVSLRGLAVSTGLFVAGISLSLVVYGGAVSQVLITIGFTGLLVSIWQGLAGFRGLNALSHRLLALEPKSYAVYLFHQPPLIVIAKAMGTGWLSFALGVAALVVVTVLVGPVEEVMRWCGRRFRQHSTSLSWLFSMGALLLLVLLPVGEPHLGDGRARDLLTWALAVFVVLTSWFNLVSGSAQVGNWLRWVAVAAAGLSLWVFPDAGAAVACVVAISGGVVYWLGRQLTRSRQAWPVLIATGGLIVGGIAITESLLRQYALPLDAGSWAELPVLTKHQTRGYAMKPNVKTELRYHYQYRIETNRDGFQGRPLLARVGDQSRRPLRIALLGDAFTMPEVVPFEKSYGALLETALGACIVDRPVEVFNLGVTGYSPIEKAVLVDEVLPRIEPDIVIDQIFKVELDWMLMSVDERHIEIGLSADGSARYRDGWVQSQIYQRTLRFTSTLAEAYSGVIAPWRLQTTLLGYFRASKQGTDWVSERQTKLADYWKRMHENARQNNYALLAFYTPAAIEVSAPGQLPYLPEKLDLPLIGKIDLEQPFELIAQAASASGVALLDPRESFRAAALSGAQLYSPEYWHWTEQGHAAAAAELQRQLVERDLLPEACRLGQVLATGESAPLQARAVGANTGPDAWSR